VVDGGLLVTIEVRLQQLVVVGVLPSESSPPLKALTGLPHRAFSQLLPPKAIQHEQDEIC